MLKKALLLSTILSAVVNVSYSQKLMHAFGTTISMLFGKVTTPNSSSSLALAQTNVTYFPRFNFIENDNSSISIGLPVGAGIGIATNTGASDAGVMLAYDLRAVLDYNFGCKSTSENENNFGGYFGVGFGYYKVSLTKSAYSDFKGATYGPIIRGGIRVTSSSEGWNGHALNVGMFYKKGIEKDKLTTVGFMVMMDL